jgi:hypothetical protein
VAVRTQRSGFCLLGPRGVGGSWGDKGGRTLQVAGTGAHTRGVSVGREAGGQGDSGMGLRATCMTEVTAVGQSRWEQRLGEMGRESPKTQEMWEAQLDGTSEPLSWESPKGVPALCRKPVTGQGHTGRLPSQG